MLWNLQDHVATWKSQRWTSSVDLNNTPRASLAHAELGTLSFRFAPRESSQQKNPSTHNSSSHLSLGDSYVRQSDLVAMYPEASPFRFGYQLYLCGIPELSGSEGSVALDIWLSVQTSTLESHPQLILQFASDTWSDASSIAEGLHLADEGTWGLLIHPLDRDDCQWDLADGNQSLVTFGRFMEKGVIRRMRLRVIAANQSVSASQWQHWMEQFAESPLPLTA